MNRNALDDGAWTTAVTPFDPAGHQSSGRGRRRRRSVVFQPRAPDGDADRRYQPWILLSASIPNKRLLSPELLSRCAATGRFGFLKDTCCDVDQIEAKLAAVEGTPLKLYTAMPRRSSRKSPRPLPSASPFGSRDGGHHIGGFRSGPSGGNPTRETVGASSRRCTCGHRTTDRRT